MIRIVQYDNECEDILEKVAKQHGVDKEKLWQLYLNIMKSNYEQDLWDIANENEEEL